VPRAKVLIGALITVAVLAGCGTVQVKPASLGATGSRGQVDDPATNQPDHVTCLKQAGLTVSRPDATDLLVGSGGSAVRVHFTPTPGSAQDRQITDAEQGAEVIGSALVYPGSASDGELATIESCLAQGVKG
jgi:hypothetical protein